MAAAAVFPENGADNPGPPCDKIFYSKMPSGSLQANTSHSQATAQNHHLHKK